MKKTLFIIIILAILAYIVFNKQETTTTLTEAQTYCYAWISEETPVPSTRTIEFTVSEDGSVTGTDDWLPAETDSNRAVFTGTKDGDSLVTIATVTGEGMTNLEERYYLLTEEGIMPGYSSTGLTLADDGVYRGPREDVVYGQLVPQVSCE